ncbi:hypothetical protein [Thermococcus sp. CX2]|uniref:hypothetical protein n=1 Tax=Thermococcus sp. CX2 TaxID=163006 RepID=UPI00143B5753|nr:hypothetical protein [Thermococcus sp. CX2]
MWTSKLIKELLEIEEVRQEIQRLAKEVRRGMFGTGRTAEELSRLRAKVNEE